MNATADLDEKLADSGGFLIRYVKKESEWTTVVFCKKTAKIIKF